MESPPASDLNPRVPPKERLDSLKRLLRRSRVFLPQGGALTEAVWSSRHRRLRQLLIAHAVGIAVFGSLRGLGPVHSIAEGMIPAMAAVLAGWPRLSRQTRAVIVSLGLMASSAILVHISGGLIEFHFHFFVMVALISLYQDWLPFLAAIGFVVLHHGSVGVLSPEAVYNHPSAWAHPWRWAALHGLFIVAMSVASMAAWRLNEFQALYDALTRLPNRELFQDRVHRALESARRTGKTTAVLLLDLDGFKKVNDSLGHAAGDRVLAEVGDRLLECIRASDVPSRLSGDEFAVLLSDVGGPHDAVRSAERIAQSLRRSFWVQEREVRLQASIGIGIAEGPRARRIGAEQLIRDADVAMYRAKSDPSSDYRIFDPVMHAAALHHLGDEADLRAAVERKDFVVHYQPIVRLDWGTVRGVEALVRWRHPARGLVLPSEFILLAEETGLIVPLGGWVLREACREVAAWPEGPGGGRLNLNVNMSPRQLADPELIDGVTAALADTGFDPSRLVLEITEGALVEDTEAAIRQLEALRSLGIRIALDDFGMGLSSLRRLPRLPVDMLKIDRLFVEALARGEPEGSLVGMVVRLAETWGLDLIAEGIEEPEELAKLREAGCTIGQGFYFGRPVPGLQAQEAIAAESRFSTDVVDLPLA